MVQHYYIIIALVAICCISGVLLSQSHLLLPPGDLPRSGQALKNESLVLTTITNLKEELGRKQKMINGLNKQLKDFREQLDAQKKQNENLLQQLGACEAKRESNPMSAGKGNIESKEKSSNEEAVGETKESLHTGAKERFGASTLGPVRHSACRLLSREVSNRNRNTNAFAVPSALFVWTESLNYIHNASALLPQDPEYNFHDFTAHLLRLVSSRLPRTSQTLPRSWSSLQAVLDIAWKRYEYFLSNPDALQPPEPGQPPRLSQNYSDLENIPRPVKILIMGGSLLQGTNCRKMVKDLKMQIGMALTECSWGHRLGAFLNHLFQMPLVQVTNIAMGGTNTASGSLLLQHELLPAIARRPNIIINGYSTNDMHAWTANEAQHSNTTLGDQIRTMVENFYRNATKLGQDECPNKREPIVLFLDDYIGNEQREILATMEGSVAVQALAKYYGFASISYVDLVRDWVYGDTLETWFSPEGWYKNNLDGVMIREIHPQLGMHIVAAWVVAYNILHMITTFCSVEPWRQADLEGREDVIFHSYETTRQYLPQLPVLRGDTDYVPPGKPRAPPLGLPPRLTKALSLEEISELWRNETDMQQRKNSSVCREDKPIHRTKCPFAWVSRIRVLAIPGVPETEKGDDVSYWKAHEVSNFGNPDNSSWAFQKDHAKIGVCPMNGIGSEFILEIPPRSVSRTIKDNYTLADSVTIFYMKSYGRKWENSTIKLDIMSESEKQADSVANWTMLSSVQLSGYHVKNTSETYTETIKLPSDIIIEQLRVAVTLVKGETFKIMGLLVCRLGVHV